MRLPMPSRKHASTDLGLVGMSAAALALFGSASAPAAATTAEVHKEPGGNSAGSDARTRSMGVERGQVHPLVAQPRLLCQRPPAAAAVGILSAPAQEDPPAPEALQAHRLATHMHTHPPGPDALARTVCPLCHILDGDLGFQAVGAFSLQAAVQGSMWQGWGGIPSKLCTQSPSCVLTAACSDEHLPCERGSCCC